MVAGQEALRHLRPHPAQQVRQGPLMHIAGHGLVLRRTQQQDAFAPAGEGVAAEVELLRPP